MNNNLSESLLESSEVASYPILSTTSQQSSMFSNMDWKIWLIIFLVLALLGFNIFVYLAQGTDTLVSLFKKFLNFFGIVTGDVVNVSAEGTKMVVGTTADIIDTGLTKIQELTPQGRQLTKGSIQGETIGAEDEDMQQHTNMDIMQLNTLNKALNTSTAQMQRTGKGEYSADHSASKIQSAGAGSKAGWCYIGEEAGYRTCAKVGVNDTCMSGDIFPSHEICVNPSLRS